MARKNDITKAVIGAVAAGAATYWWENRFSSTESEILAILAPLAVAGGAYIALPEHRKTVNIVGTGVVGGFIAGALRRADQASEEARVAGLETLRQAPSSAWPAGSSTPLP